MFAETKKLYEPCNKIGNKIVQPKNFLSPVNEQNSKKYPIIIPLNICIGQAVKALANATSYEYP